MGKREGPTAGSRERAETTEGSASMTRAGGVTGATKRHGRPGATEIIARLLGPVGPSARAADPTWVRFERRGPCSIPPTRAEVAQKHHMPARETVQTVHTVQFMSFYWTFWLLYGGSSRGMY